jgi:pectate lyase
MPAQPPVQPQPAPYGQPEPFDPATAAPPTRRVVTRARRPWLPILAAVVLAVVGFGAGFAVATATSSPAATTDTTQRTQGFGPGASFRPRNGAFGGGASGTVGSVSANQMTITTAAGGQRIVLLTTTTTVTQVTSATKALTDLASGQTVTVVGTSNPDGSVTATRIIIGDVSILGRGGVGPGASATP